LFSLISSPPEASFTAHPQYPLVLYSVLVLSLHLGVNSEILWKEPFDWESKVNFELHICFMLGSHIWPCFLLSKVMMTSCTWMMWQDCFKDRYDNVGKELWKWFKDIRIPDIIIMGYLGVVPFLEQYGPMLRTSYKYSWWVVVSDWAHYSYSYKMKPCSEMALLPFGNFHVWATVIQRGREKEGSCLFKKLCIQFA
jgi:hypothetical protein